VFRKGWYDSYAYASLDLCDTICPAFQWYWVSWNDNGQIALGYGQQVARDTLMVFSDFGTPYKIKAVGGASSCSPSSVWTIPGYFKTSNNFEFFIGYSRSSRL
jgi:hypothetical protein